MKLVLLDIDGVLNHSNTEWNEWAEGSCVDVLNAITKTNDAKIVVVSAQRIGHDAEYMADMLASVGVEAELVGITPELGVRDAEIKEWVVGHADMITSMVLIDDSYSARYNDIQVQTEWEHGLQDKHIEQANEILNK